MSKKYDDHKELVDIYEIDEEGDLVCEPSALYRLDEQKLYTVEDYYNLPGDDRYELIDGILYKATAPNRIHQRVLLDFIKQVDREIAKNGGDCEVFILPTDVQLDDNTILQPDMGILCDKDKDSFRNINGAPDFVLEIISRSTASYDRGLKLRKYRDAGVREYWILDPYKRILCIHYFEKNVSRIVDLKNPAQIGIYEGKIEVDFTIINEIIDYYENMKK